MKNLKYEYIPAKNTWRQSGQKKVNVPCLLLLRLRQFTMISNRYCYLLSTHHSIGELHKCLLLAIALLVELRRVSVFAYHRCCFTAWNSKLHDNNTWLMVDAIHSGAECACYMLCMEVIIDFVTKITACRVVWSWHSKRCHHQYFHCFARHQLNPHIYLMVSIYLYGFHSMVLLFRLLLLPTTVYILA